MYSASHRKIGEYDNGMRLEVGAEFFGGYPKDQCCLIETDISSFCLR